MGEDSGDRSKKRQRSSRGIDKASSDTELAQSKGKGWKLKEKEKWPFLEGLTVDELSRYRRRRVQGQPKDNLGLCPKSEGEDLVSEYYEAFGTDGKESHKGNVQLKEQPKDPPPPEDSTEKSEPSDDEHLEYETRNDFLTEGKRSATSSISMNEDKTMETETASTKFIAHANPSRRPSVVRRGTTLKRDGEFHADTETCSSYVAYEGQHRPGLARRPTSLKMEGDLETTTEKCEKFIRWLNVTRPELMRVPTHLKLEGEFETLTENHEKYVPFVGVRRPELLRQTTNLKLEGESTFVPEYADVFRVHNRERSQPMKPESQIKIGKDFFQSTENTDTSVNRRTNGGQLRTESNRDAEKGKRQDREQEEKNRKEEEMKILVSKLEDLKGPPLEIPEHKDAYKDFPRERPKIVKPEDEIGQINGFKISSSPTPKFSTKIDQDPEYKSKYLNYHGDHLAYRRPPLTVKSTTASPDRNAGLAKQKSKRFDYEHTSEVRSQYVPYGHVPRVESLKMPANLRLEGSHDFEPEYRTAYCKKYQSCAEPKMHRKRDRSLSASRRKENYWINSNNAKQSGCVNAVQDQDAFQVLNTRIREENTVGKPPPGSRRGSRTLQIQLPKPTQLDKAECNALKEQSSSPTYRLHVYNVDDESHGFRQRRSPSLQSSARIRSPSPNRLRQSDVNRPYSPSFGKSTKHSNDQSFVVLDNGIFHTDKNNVRRRRSDKNYNIDSMHSHPKGRTRNSTNWMPPWYDSTNTI